MTTITLTPNPHGLVKVVIDGHVQPGTYSPDIDGQELAAILADIYAGSLLIEILPVNTDSELP